LEPVFTAGYVHVLHLREKLRWLYGHHPFVNAQYKQCMFRPRRCRRGLTAPNTTILIRSRTKASYDLVRRDRNGASRLTGSKRLRDAVMQASIELKDCLERLAADFERVESSVDEQAALPSAPFGSSSETRPASGFAVIHYLLTSNDLRIILTTSNAQSDYHVKLAEGEINRLVYEMRSALQERSEQFLSAAQRLYAILIAPFGLDLASAQIHTLMFSLDGVLRYLPMAALHDGARYLLEDFAILLTTGGIGESGTSRGATALAGAGLGTSGAFGGLASLAGVREELEAIIRTSDASEGIVPGIIRLDADFTAEALREAASSGNAVLHVASHFVFAVARETSSYLQLGDGSRLTLSELQQLRFDGVDLVVLSACNTAVAAGHHQNGREIEGLGALVRGHGAGDVVATLWSVADLTTAALMRAFYENRYIQGIASPEALRRAQLSLLRGDVKSALWPRTRGLIDPDDDPNEYRRRVGAAHPFYWAPYVLMGEPPRAAQDQSG